MSRTQRRLQRAQRRQRLRLRQATQQVPPFLASLFAPEGEVSIVLGRPYADATDEEATHAIAMLAAAVGIEAHRRGFVEERPVVDGPDPDPAWFTFSSIDIDGTSATQVDLGGCCARVVIAADPSGWSEILHGLVELVQHNGVRGGVPTRGVLSALISYAPTGVGGDA